MDSTLTITLADDETKQQLADCVVGKQKELTLLVTPTAKTDGQLTARIDSIEYAESVEDEEPTVESPSTVPKEVVEAGMKSTAKY